MSIEGIVVDQGSDPMPPSRGRRGTLMSGTGKLTDDTVMSIGHCSDSDGPRLGWPRRGLGPWLSAEGKVIGRGIEFGRSPSEHRRCSPDSGAGVLGGEASGLVRCFCTSLGGLGELRKSELAPELLLHRTCNEQHRHGRRRGHQAQAPPWRVAVWLG